MLIADVVALFVVGDDGPFDEEAAAACGRELAREISLEPLLASARLEDRTWRITVSTNDGVLGFIVRPDREVLEVALVGPGGSQALPREDRLAIFERGC